MYGGINNRESECEAVGYLSISGWGPFSNSWNEDNGKNKTLIEKPVSCVARSFDVEPLVSIHNFITFIKKVKNGSLSQENTIKSFMI